MQLLIGFSSLHGRFILNALASPFALQSGKAARSCNHVSICAYLGCRTSDTEQTADQPFARRRNWQSLVAWQTKSYQSSQLTLPCICLQDPSILHFLLASGDKISSKQLRDDLMTMLIAGHETTAAVLTWTLHCCSTRPDVVQRMQQEVRLSVPAWSCAELRGVRWWVHQCGVSTAKFSEYRSGARSF